MKSQKNHFIVKTILPIMLFICIYPKLTISQSYPRIDTLLVIPQAPSISDSIIVRLDLTIPKRGSKIKDSLSISSDTIHIYSHLLNGFQSAFMTFQDTFSVGKLPAGKYFIKLKAKMDLPTSMGNIPWDSTSALDSFVVYDDVSLYEVVKAGKTKVQLYPNPSSGKQQISHFTQIPQPLQINLHSISGQKVLKIYNGQSVQGQQEFEVDMSHLPNGVYFYHVKLGEETKHLKAIKQ